MATKLFFCLAFFVVLTCAQDTASKDSVFEQKAILESVTAQAPVVTEINKLIQTSSATTSKPAPSTTLKPASTTTLNPTPAPSTTLKPSSTTTPSPTTQPAPSPSPRPSPSPAPSTTTTVAPTSPTPAPSPSSPTTTAVPTPAPHNDIPWVVKDGNKTCILAKIDMHFNIPYNTTDHKSVVGTVVVPKNATASGSCNNQTLVLSWAGSDFVYFTFKSNETTKRYWISSIIANLTADSKNFRNSTAKYFVLTHIEKAYSTTLGKSYSCPTVQNLPMILQPDNTGATINFNNIQFDAFHTNNKTEFSAAELCESGQTPDIVPIVVGCLLAALVVLVLVGYLIGRRRSQARGYTSM